jgi:hypothetical protein
MGTGVRVEEIKVRDEEMAPQEDERIDGSFWIRLQAVEERVATLEAALIELREAARAVL